METQELKERLIKKIEGADKALLLQLENFLNSSEKEEDWFYGSANIYSRAYKGIDETSRRR